MKRQLIMAMVALATHLTVDIVTWLLEAPKEQDQAPLGIKCQSVS